MSAAHPVYRGPVIDGHVHFDAGGRAAAHAVLADPALPDALVNFWDTTWPPPAFPDWERTWRAERARGMALLHMPDLSGVGAPGFEAALVRDLEAAARAGAAGVKVWKNLGLTLHDAAGRRLTVDDERLVPLWETAASLGLTVAIHVGDPPGFFAPLEPGNERYRELQEHPEYWFGDSERFPRLEQIHEQFERVVARHPRTTFVGLHFGCFMEMEDVARMLAAYPHYHVDTATRTFDLAREPTRERALAIFARFPERMVFGTDLIRTDGFDLPAAPAGRARTDVAALYRHHWRVFETTDDDIPVPFAFLPPWRLHGLGLAPDALRLLYHDNARRLFRVLD